MAGNGNGNVARSSHWVIDWQDAVALVVLAAGVRVWQQGWWRVCGGLQVAGSGLGR